MAAGRYRTAGLRLNMNISVGKPLSWCYEGQKVLAPCRIDGKRWLLLCTVVKACGYSALVANDARGFAKWFDVNDLHEAISTKEPEPCP